MEPESPSHIFVQNWLSSHQNQNQNQNHHHHESCKLTINDPFPEANQVHDFDFGGNMENKMCSADDVFFQGQIIPITPIMSCCFGNTSTTSHIRHDLGGNGNNGTPHSSGGSGCGDQCRRNHFLCSQPSIKLHIQNPRPAIHHPPKTSSSKWNFLHLGPTVPQEIRLAHLRNRNNINIKDHHKNDNTTTNKKKKMKKKMPSFGICNCKCSTDDDVIETALTSSLPPPSSLLIKPTNKRADLKNAHACESF